jgi:hypothetical protein
MTLFQRYKLWMGRQCSSCLCARRPCFSLSYSVGSNLHIKQSLESHKLSHNALHKKGVLAYSDLECAPDLFICQWMTRPLSSKFAGAISTKLQRLA